MKIAIDISPLSSGHKVRGVGFYLEHLKNSLVKYAPENEYVFFNTGDKLDNNIDLVHFPYFEPFFLALPLYKKFKTVVTVHDLTPIVFPDAFPSGFKGKIKWQMQKISLRKANRIITDSKNSKSDIIKHVGYNEDKIDVVYLAAGEKFKQVNKNDPILKKVKNKYSLPQNFALYVGDVTWNKNLPRLINAAKTANVQLVMVGKSLASQDYDKNNPWNHDLNRVNELSKENGNIIRSGFVDDEDLVAIYNLAKVFVMPSLYEGFGLPVLEAQACGCPVISTKEGSLKEVGNDSVYFVDAYNQDSIAKGIKEVFQKDLLREELINKGFENIKRFSWEKTAEQTISTYKKVI